MCCIGQYASRFDSKTAKRHAPEQAIALTSCATINHAGDISLPLITKQRFTVVKIGSTEFEYAIKRLDNPK